MYTSLILRYHLVLRLNARIGSVQEGHFRGAFEKKKLKVQNTKTCQLCWSFTLPNADSIGRRHRAHKLAGVKVSFPLSCNVVEECKRAVARSESITLPHMRGTKRELQQSVWVHTKQCHLKYETFSHNWVNLESTADHILIRHYYTTLPTILWFRSQPIYSYHIFFSECFTCIQIATLHTLHGQTSVKTWALQVYADSISRSEAFSWWSIVDSLTLLGSPDAELEFLVRKATLSR